jgi:hypothetical protein
LETRKKLKELEIEDKKHMETGEDKRGSISVGI